MHVADLRFGFAGAGGLFGFFLRLAFGLGGIADGLLGGGAGRSFGFLDGAARPFFLFLFPFGDFSLDLLGERFQLW